MNFNANAGPRQSLGRKVKRVSDVNAMGYNPAMQQAPYINGQEMGNNPNFQPPMQQTQQQTAGNYMNSPMPQRQGFSDPSQSAMPYNYDPNIYNNTPKPNIGVFGQPVVQNMAMQYGQQLADTGKSMVKQEIERFVPVTHLKYYFAVDTSYVISKLKLLLFPFIHKDWSLKYEQDGRPVQPRYEINAPDLYIPTMAYVTYILVAGLVLGMQNKFSPEQIGIQSSSALAWCVVELAIYSCALYIANIQTNLRTLDLVAFSGYKFVGIIVSIMFSMVAGSAGYYCILVYTSLALAFFLSRSLKAQILPEASTHHSDQVSGGYKRRLYFLFSIALAQPVLSWWLSFHLVN